MHEFVKWRILVKFKKTLNKKFSPALQKRLFTGASSMHLPGVKYTNEKKDYSEKVYLYLPFLAAAVHTRNVIFWFWRHITMFLWENLGVVFQKQNFFFWKPATETFFCFFFNFPFFFQYFVLFTHIFTFSCIKHCINGLIWCFMQEKVKIWAKRTKYWTKIF